MSNAPPIPCARCGARRTVRAQSLGLCPACLLASALEWGGSCPYDIVSPMDEDAAGVTSLAMAPGGGYVALKVFHDGPDVDAVIARYRHWKPALDGLRHTAIVRLLDVGRTEDEALYVASEFVAGRPLSAALRQGPLTPEARDAIVRQLTEALAAVHATGLVHLSLDASRVRVSTDGRMRVSVLGVGRRLIVDGAAGGPDDDRLDLARIVETLRPGV